MTKISNQYSLTNILTADLANSRLGINNVSPTVALDVTGAGKFSGILTLGSTISNGTYAYTLPSATGTLALTSALSGYLPLTGGTLTGALSGTSATFSTDLTLTNSSFTLLKFINTTASKTWNMYAYSDGQFNLGISGVGNFLTLGTTGAATFSSSVSATSYNATTQNIFAVDGTERMRITSAGNVGIGTSSPNVSGQGTNQRVLTVQGVSGYWGGVEIASTATAGGSLMGFLGFAGSNINTGLTAYIGSWLENTGADAAADMRFHTKPASAAATEKMRITGGGNILMGTTSDNGSRLSVQGAINCLGTAAGIFTQSRSSAELMGWYAENTTYLYFYHTIYGATGRITSSSGVYTAISDVNKKKDFEQSQIGLNEVLGLKPTLYRMKTDDESSSKHLGFIAQEVKDYIPQAYSESGEGNDKFIGLTEMPIIAALTKAIQELSAENTSLINRIEALENK